MSIPPPHYSNCLLIFIGTFSKTQRPVRNAVCTLKISWPRPFTSGKIPSQPPIGEAEFTPPADPLNYLLPDVWIRSWNSRHIDIQTSRYQYCKWRYDRKYCRYGNIESWSLTNTLGWKLTHSKSAKEYPSCTIKRNFSCVKAVNQN
jgi:hypothetical protein